MAQIYLAVDNDGYAVAMSCNKGYLKSFIREVNPDTRFCSINHKNIEEVKLVIEILDEWNNKKNENRRKHAKRLAINRARKQANHGNRKR